LYKSESIGRISDACGSILKNLLDIQIFLKLEAEKQRDQLKKENKRLENCIADLLKQAAVNKDKLDRLKQILDE
jgi:hypothetical protein